MDELEILANLCMIARIEQAVAKQQLDEGMQMLVYPMQRGMLVGLGFEGNEAHRVHAQEVVRKRSENIEQLGAWLPAMFSDEGMYIVRRFDHMPDVGESLPLSEEELMAAKELLS
ncbi:hypothetical protein D3870_21150 [Noviherbaspirillum cavernae]|uniref:Uncharacterized protein n=2 Tax=Noviherbaspirillum cavernae TaxID=2320862 RepID=A0A418WWG9_9BURK|nr:hypothetical protein D3870_21150 [Noviherbaspirillum cavernae]